MSKFNFNIDNIEDNETPISKSKYNSKSQKELLELYNDVVDLCLPSGTLWCKYNLGINPNQLAEHEDWYDSYYAWAEIQPKEKYTWDNYKFGNYNELTKYCNNPIYGLNGCFFDNLTELLPEDDAAYQNKKFNNFKFHIPTKKQFEELKNYTDNYWVKNYDPNKIVHNREDDGGIQGLNGRIFEGKNEKQLFIPAAGYCYGSRVSNAGSYSSLWSSNLSLSRTDYAYFLGFDLGGIDMGSGSRYIGYPVRPVINL